MKLAKTDCGYTYFVRSGNAIKIGHSAIPKSRISNLQTGFPGSLEILAVVPSTIIDEMAAHKKFAHLRMNGEWFRADPELVEFALEMKLRADGFPNLEKARSDLIAKRVRYGADTTAGHRCSNIVKQLENLRFATDKDQRQRLKEAIAKQTAELEQLTAP